MMKAILVILKRAMLLRIHLATNDCCAANQKRENPKFRLKKKYIELHGVPTTIDRPIHDC
uniref:Secreted protein n=1 Tax=Ascaris lumbricoides TaxID=6252 RepID=A0A0M3I2G8_ASCLU